MKYPLKTKFIISLGLLSGLLYAAFESYLDHHALGKGQFLDTLHDTLDLLIPLAVGVLSSIYIKLYFDQRHSNIALSVENTRLKSKLITHILASYVLHEIRNPIHNIMAALENNARLFKPNDLEIINRNITRLQDLTTQLKGMNLLSENINLRESVFFPAWLQTFINRSFSAPIKKYGVKVEVDTKPLTVNIHPLLLEQCFMLLFDNALTAVCASDNQTGGIIRVTADLIPQRPGYALIKIENSGQLIPEDVIAACGNRIVKSTSSSGIGLVLVHDTLKQINGSLTLSNQNSLATVTLHIPTTGDKQ